MGDYGIELDGWGDYMDARDEERWDAEYEAFMEAQKPEVAATAAPAKRAKNKARVQRTKAQKPAFVVPPGSVVNRNTIVSPDGWVTVVPRGSKIKK